MNETPDKTPSFPKSDPATPAFWDMRFDAAFTPWDQGGVPLSLREFTAAQPGPRSVLIPGCGSAWEVRFLAEAGWEVQAVDFSPAAVARARAQLGRHAPLVYEADFFALAKPAIDTMYERAFLCALPRTRWDAWAQKMAELLPAGGLLIGFFFFDDNEKGPPFGLSENRLRELLGSRFELCEEKIPPDSIAVFQGKERWMVWKRKEH